VFDDDPGLVKGAPTPIVAIDGGWSRNDVDREGACDSRVRSDTQQARSMFVPDLGRTYY
jgi:hypothetical protein